jgi:N-acetylneuraminic acid mutarotase
MNRCFVLSSFLFMTCVGFVSCGGDSPAPGDVPLVPDQSGDLGVDLTASDQCSGDALVNDAVLQDGTGDAAGTARFQFPGEVAACQENANLAAVVPILNGGKTHPTGRGEQGAAYDLCNNRIILFGGNDYQPEQCADFGPKRFQGDTWMYVPEYQNWAKIETSPAPNARGRHMMAFDHSRKKVYLFGGRFRPETSAGDYQLFNDLWSFDVNLDTWTQLYPTGAAPSARANSSMIYDDIKDRLILFGGSTSANGLNFFPQNDTYTLDLDTLVWTKVAESTAPPARLFHTLVMDQAHNSVLLYGGGDENAFFGPFYNDLWALNLETLQWQLIWQKSGFGDGPDARINPAMVEDRDGGVVLLFGGHDDTSVGHRNDVWSFDAAQGAWTSVVEGDTGAGVGCSSFCDCPPDFVDVDMASPERRQYHTWVTIPSEDRAVLFGGKGDCGYLDDTWSFSFEDLAWTEVEPAGQGESCKRSGEEGCTDLCY